MKFSFIAIIQSCFVMVQYLLFLILIYVLTRVMLFYHKFWYAFLHLDLNRIARLDLAGDDQFR